MKQHENGLGLELETVLLIHDSLTSPQRYVDVLVLWVN